MIEFCKEVVEAIKPLIQYEGDYDVRIIDKPIRDENGKIIKQNKSRLNLIPAPNDDYFLTVYINTVIDDEAYEFVSNRGFSEFLDGIGIENSYHARLVLICLHEFGHLNMALECRMNGSIKNMNSAIYINESATRTIFPTKYVTNKRHHEKNSIKYRYSFSENYADKFALIYFMKVWNQVKHLV